MAEQEREDTLLAREMLVNGRFVDINLHVDPLDGEVFAAVLK